MDQLIQRDNCHPARGFLAIWFQIPIWLSLSFSLRNLAFMFPISDAKAQLIHSQLASEGVLWISNLTIADPYFIFPVLFGLTNLITIEVRLNLKF